jgi:hypothetical protein
MAGGTAGGTAGSAAGGAGGAAGSSAAGAGGGTAGAAGGAAGAAGGTAGTGTDGGAGAAGGKDGGGADAALPACNVTSDNGPALSAADLCTLYFHNCQGVAGVTIPDSSNTMEKCVATYMAATTAAQNCRSHHLCASLDKDTATRVTHCPHVVGMGGYCM